MSWNPIKAVKQWALKKAVERILGGQMFDKIKAVLSGKKSYFIALITAILGLVQAYGIYIPEWVYVILGALGLTTLRAGVSKNEPPK